MLGRYCYKWELPETQFHSWADVRTNTATRARTAPSCQLPSFSIGRATADLHGSAYSDTDSAPRIMRVPAQTIGNVAEPHIGKRRRMDGRKRETGCHRHFVLSNTPFASALQASSSFSVRVCPIWENRKMRLG